jgi:ABC-type molybdenum transport system ATPase subunit/photorepair protein PhrA
VLLLDEPVAGVPEGDRQEIFDIINAPAARRVGAADRARHGPGVQFRQARDGAGQRRGVREGDVQSIANDPRVKSPSIWEGEGEAIRRSWRMAELLRSTGLYAGYGEAVVVQGVSWSWSKGSRWRCWAATAPARRPC